MLYTGHINNLYNTTFWNMVLKGGMDATEAELALKVSLRMKMIRDRKRRAYGTRALSRQTRTKSSSSSSVSTTTTNPKFGRRAVSFLDRQGTPSILEPRDYMLTLK